MLTIQIAKNMFMIYLNKSGFVILRDQWICSVAKSDHARKNYGAGANGIIDAEYAVLDASVGEDYSRVNAVRTSLDGLCEWLGISSVLVSAPIVDDNNRVREGIYA